MFPTVLVLSAICIACGESRSEGNVSPGDVDYPAANPTPTRLVELDVAMPGSLEVNMSAIYQSEITAMSHAGRPCGYKSTFEALLHPFNVTNAVTFKDESRPSQSHDPQPRKLQATLILDKYSGDACHWHFAGVIWHLPKGDRLMGEDMFAIPYDRARDGAKLGDIPRGPAYLVCSKDPRATDPSHAERCTTLTAMQAVSHIPPEVVASLPEEVAGNRGVTWIMPDTKVIQITFFDLDAPNPK